MKYRDSFLTTPGTILPSSFVGRRKEFHFLSNAFFSEGKKVISLHGLGGIGKSAFAAMFANKNQNKFPGGVVVVNFPISSAVQSKLEKLQKDKQCLIIWDDLDFMQDSNSIHHIESTVNRYHGSFHILISRYQIDHKIIDSHVNLGTLNHAEMYSLFKTRLKGHTDGEFEKLWELFVGHPLAAELAFSTIRNGIFSVDEIIRGLRDFETSGLYGPDGRPLSDESYDSVITDISSVNDDLLKRLDREPEIFYQLTSRKYEEVIAELLNRMGYQITLTPATRDGGKDIYAAKKDTLGTFLYIVECKKYGPNNHVGVGLIRELYGVVQAEKATAGILATTSYFSKPAQEFQEAIKYHVSLRDYIDIQKWLKNIIIV